MNEILFTAKELEIIRNGLSLITTVFGPDAGYSFSFPLDPSEGSLGCLCLTIYPDNTDTNAAQANSEKVDWAGYLNQPAEFREKFMFDIDWRKNDQKE